MNSDNTSKKAKPFSELVPKIEYFDTKIINNRDLIGRYNQIYTYSSNVTAVQNKILEENAVNTDIHQIRNRYFAREKNPIDSKNHNLNLSSSSISNRNLPSDLFQ